MRAAAFFFFRQHMALFEQLAKDAELVRRIHAGQSAAAAHREYVAPTFGYGEITTRRAVALIKGAPHASRSAAVPRIGHSEFRQNADGTAVVTIPASLRIMTEDELLDVCQIDRSRWRVKALRANKWEQANAEGVITQLFQIRADLVPIENGAWLTALREELLDLVRKGAPRYPAIRRSPIKGERYLYELSLADLHIGKYAWAEETGGDDYDTDIASERLRVAVMALIEKAKSFPIERILWVVGNDLLQADNERNETTRGTRQDVDTRYKRVFRIACDLQVWAIERLREVAPVDVLVVPGNHDQLSAFHVGMFLEAWFRHAKDVSIDNAAALRKYYRYGRNLLGFAHGNEEKPADLPLIMAVEEKRQWAETSHHEWHLGHYHTRRETRYTAGDTHKGVVVRILPSLCGADAWHHSRGYIGGPKAAEAYLYEYRGGYAGHFSHNIITA